MIVYIRGDHGKLVYRVTISENVHSPLSCTILGVHK